MLGSTPRAAPASSTTGCSRDRSLSTRSTPMTNERMTHQQIEVPAGGARIVPGDADSRQPDHPLHRGRRDRRRHHPGDAGASSTPPSRRPTAATRAIHWMEIYAGEKATRLYGSDVWLPDETLEAARDYTVSIKGPMTTPVGGGIRSLNVALRQQLDLFVCLRPVRYFPGVPSPLQGSVRRPTWSSSARTPRTSTRASSGRPSPTGARKRDRLPPGRDGRARRSASRTRRASASSRSRARAPSGSCARRSATRSTTGAARSRSCTRATS